MACANCQAAAKTWITAKCRKQLHGRRFFLCLQDCHVGKNLKTAKESKDSHQKHEAKTWGNMLLLKVEKYKIILRILNCRVESV